MRTQLQPLKDKSTLRRTCKTGNAKVDRFFHEVALQLHEDNLAYTRVLKYEGSEEPIIGFITTNVTELSKQDLPSGFVKKGAPNQGVPLLRLCYIGVNEEFQRRSYGSLLLQEVFHIAIELNDLTGCAGIILDVVEEEKLRKIKWYQQFGFELLAGSDKTMVLSIKTILTSLS